jgi:predicted xylose isomerase-like sugar epimerase
MTPRIPIAAITDEFSLDLELALAAMHEIGMSAAELRVVWGKNIVDLNDDEVHRVQAMAQVSGFQIVSIRSTAAFSMTFSPRSIPMKTSRD